MVIQLMALADVYDTFEHLQNKFQLIANTFKD